MTTARLPRRPKLPTAPKPPKMPRGWVPPVANAAAAPTLQPGAEKVPGPRDWSPTDEGSAIAGGGGLPGTPPKRGRQGKPPRPPKIPTPPRRSPVPPRPPVILTQRDQVIRSALAIVAILIFGFLANLTVLGQLQHIVSQQQLTNTFRYELSQGTAPVSEGTVDKVLLTAGTPVAVLDIPSIDVHEIVVEGTDSGTLRTGPGHRRDTPLPGQSGISVLMGRAAAYGGPFARLQELRPGQQFTVITGQGEQTFSVLGLRYAGDPAPATLGAGKSRLILESARGPAYVPSGVVRVDAELVSETKPAGKRQTTFATLPLQDKELATDTTTVWALVFALQFLLVIELAAVWAFRRVGLRKTWIVFLPVVTVGGLFVADQLVRLLPNLL
ncbi:MULTISPECIES: sortase [unclassified Cryobacterium]|uniref:sortase n=1 Tax=unclassified Cryobacterium TaxID=2649013 RepID=UPI002AB4E8B7|nr:MULTISPECIES: sortase [unclassified Cryobacterium]MDY7543001.1 sortase [Cryobacterium sp. 5B3]MEA9999298.1 sortase [Cryobacterium sp. RTS3]MEB0266108.1 sortase [Cryobacterium sp. 10I5]MEB0274056.1 sortase [Cryobacterium sp. 5B3]